MVNYWSNEIDDILIEYNMSNDMIEREQLYREHLHKPLRKVCEVMVNKLYAPHMPPKKELQDELLTYAILQLHKYSSYKGKSFSYFTVILKNRMLYLREQSYKQELDMTDIMGWVMVDELQDIVEETHHKTKYPTELLYLPEVDSPSQYNIPWNQFPINTLMKKHRKVGKEIIHILTTHSFTHKKEFLKIIRQKTNCNTSIITRILKRMTPWVQEYTTKITL